LLDEPLSALDGPTRLELRGELKRLHKELGATVLHVTHDLDEALVLGQKVAVLIGGDLRQVGTPSEVTRFPADVAVARLVKSGNLFPVVSFEPAFQAPETTRRVVLENGLRLVAGEGRELVSADPVYAAIRADEITLEPWVPSVPAGARPAEPENVLPGKVSTVQIQSAHVVVEVQVPAHAGSASAAARVRAGEGVPFTVHLPRAELERKGLSVGVRVRVLFPARAVHVCAGAPSRPVVSLPAF
jgi:ABC-type Fe3+/spermidine/putrescine transport system ATPase subunit